jgi:hypothetical protein
LLKGITGETSPEPLTVNPHIPPKPLDLMLVLTHKGEFTKSIYNRVNLVEPGVLSKKKKKNIVDIGVE